MKKQEIVRKILRVLLLYPFLIIASPLMVPALWIISFIIDEGGNPLSGANEITMWYIKGCRMDIEK